MKTEPPAAPPFQDRRRPVAVRQRDRLSRLLVWLVPFGVLLVCVYLVQHNLLSAGPRIRVAFSGDVAVEAEKTPLKYKGVEVGRVKKVYLTTDLKQVIVEIQLEDFARAFAAQGAQFWVVRPQITPSGVHGIETLTSGAYIEGHPGKGAKSVSFEGLSEDPEHSSDINALKLTLIADKITKLQVGSAVLYRGVAVGQVSSIALDQKADDVKIGIFVQGPYRTLVNRSTSFNVQGGFEAGFSLTSGAKLQISSLSTILNGAIEFATPNRAAPPVDPRLPIQITKAKDESDDKTGAAAGAKNALHLTLIAHNITKLQVGSEVQYRGLAVGAVDAITLDKQRDDVKISIHVDDKNRDLINASTKFWYTNGVQADFSLFKGAKLQLSSLPVIMNGAIDFTTPDSQGPRLNPRATIPLYDDYDKKWDEKTR